MISIISGKTFSLTNNMISQAAFIILLININLLFKSFKLISNWFTTFKIFLFMLISIPFSLLINHYSLTILNILNISLNEPYLHPRYESYAQNLNAINRLTELSEILIVFWGSDL